MEKENIFFFLSFFFQDFCRRKVTTPGFEERRLMLTVLKTLRLLASLCLSIPPLFFSEFVARKSSFKEDEIHIEVPLDSLS